MFPVILTRIEVSIISGTKTQIKYELTIRKHIQDGK
jgi:hypothetical protein